MKMVADENTLSIVNVRRGKIVIYQYHLQEIEEQDGTRRKKLEQDEIDDINDNR